MTIISKTKGGKEKKDSEDGDLPSTLATNHTTHVSSSQVQPSHPGHPGISAGSSTVSVENHTSLDPPAITSGHKRRHRSSPHRVARKHRHDRPDRNNTVLSAVPTSASLRRGPGHSSSQLLPQHTTSLHGSIVSGSPLVVSSGRASANVELSVPVTSVDNSSIVQTVSAVPTSTVRPRSNVSTLKCINSSGYNSDDENDLPYSDFTSEEEAMETEVIFEAALKKERHFIIKQMNQDGACLFRAVADQVFGDQEMHSVVRKNCVDHMAKNSDYFQQYVTEDFETYIHRKHMAHVHGNHVEIQAMCELYNRPIEVYKYSLDPMNIFQTGFHNNNDPLRLSYHRNTHYNSVVDPYKATIGVGLGLPGHQPGLADKNLLKDAMEQSEKYHLEECMLKDKLKQTDWEQTQTAIEETAFRESYLQWLKDNEARCQGKHSPHSTPASSSATWWEKDQEYQLHESTSQPPVKCEPTPCSSSESGMSKPSTSHQPDQCVTNSDEPVVDLAMDLFGLTEYGDEEAVLAQVMLQSQQEYVESLSQSSCSSGHPSTL